MAPPVFICSDSSISSTLSDDALSMPAPSSPASGVCQCENQLAHWDWAGRPHENLPVQCRSQLAIEEDDSVAASEYNNDCESPKMKVESDSEEVKQARLHVPNKSADEPHIATEGANSMNNKGPAYTKRKREGNSGGRTCKEKKTTSIHIKFSGGGGTQSSVEISAKFCDDEQEKTISINI